MITVYGIKNCDTVKRARKWLEKHNVTYSFHDLRDDGLSKTQLNAWCSQLDWQDLLNKRSTTWRNLAEADKSNLNKAAAIKIMLLNPTVIKRPIITVDTQLSVGFDEKQFQQLFP